MLLNREPGGFPGAYFYLFFCKKCFVKSITTILPHPEIDIRKCIKSKPGAASNPDPLLAVHHTDRNTTPLLPMTLQFFYLYSFRSSPIFFCRTISKYASGGRNCKLKERKLLGGEIEEKKFKNKHSTIFLQNTVKAGNENIAAQK